MSTLSLTGHLEAVGHLVMLVGDLGKDVVVSDGLLLVCLSHLFLLDRSGQLLTASIIVAICPLYPCDWST